MNGMRFDFISQRFAGRRESRRQAASPTADSPAREKTMFLFVQSFESGSIAPKVGTDGTYTLTLQHGLGETVYFSDRPKRIVGSAPTPHVLDSLGFSPDNPPNAALVVGTDDGGTDIAVVELTNPAYDTASFTATYDISVLENFEGGVDMQLQDAPADLATVARSFGAAHLFIDDCADTIESCWRYFYDENDNPCAQYAYVGNITSGNCWDWETFRCKPCGSYSSLCYTTFPADCNDSVNGACFDDIDLCDSPACCAAQGGCACP